MKISQNSLEQFAILNRTVLSPHIKAGFRFLYLTVACGFCITSTTICASACADERSGISGNAGPDGTPLQWIRDRDFNFSYFGERGAFLLWGKTGTGYIAWPMGVSEPSMYAVKLELVKKESRWRVYKIVGNDIYLAFETQTRGGQYEVLWSTGKIWSALQLCSVYKLAHQTEAVEKHRLVKTHNNFLCRPTGVASSHESSQF